MRSAPAIGFELRPSRRLIIATLAMTALAVLAIVLCAAAWWLKCLLTMATLATAGQSIRRLCLPRYRRINHDQAGWQITARDGSSITAELVQQARLGSLTVLHFRLPQQHWRFLIAPDMIDADTRRRLLLTLASLHDPAVDQQPLA